MVKSGFESRRETVSELVVNVLPNEDRSWVHPEPLKKVEAKVKAMDAIDSSEHYAKAKEEAPASLLVIILDTNPHAWALLADDLPLSAAISNLCVFINAHLAFNDANKVAVIASHSKRAVFLYPPPPSPSPSTQTSNGSSEDVEMANGGGPSSSDANTYRPFHTVQTALFSSLRSLFETTTPSSLSPTTSIAGALTLALTYINKCTLLANSILPSSSTTASGAHADNAPILLTSRILILSVSGDLAHQYIPMMNTIFACQRLSIPIDIAKIAGDTVFLQQASDATRGTFMQLEHPQGLLQYLMKGFLPDATSRKFLIAPNQAGVDFRAACFCHRKVIDMGYVCSICLSIFCSPPESSICLTCGTHLSLGDYGKVPAVVPKKKKKAKTKGKIADLQAQGN